MSLTDYQDVLVSKLDMSVQIDGDAVEIKLQKALLTLPDKQRLVFNMKYFDLVESNRNTLIVTII